MGHDTHIVRKTDTIEDHLPRPVDGLDNTHHDVLQLNHGCPEGASVTRIEVIDAVSDPRTKYVLYAGLAMVMIIFELDNSTVSTYRNFAASEFNQLSMLATLNTVTSIISAVSKPPIAKLSDVLGRAEAYIITVTCYVLSYILCAAAKSFDTYAGGCVLYALGQAGTSMLNAIVISDISSMRWRGFVYNILYLPFLVTPWISAFIVDSVVNGIGWRWGIGIDLGGIAILTCGFSSLLIPTTLAAKTTSRWKTAWIDALIVLGAVFLACLYPYEKYIAKHPVIPVRYFHSLSVLVPMALACIDNIGFGTTHTYLYAWSMVSHNFSPRNAQFLSWTSGVMQALAGMCIGLLMYRLRRYKWIAVAGAIVRMIGYGLMIRLRTNTSSLAELFIVQLIQGLGSGIIETVLIVAAQICVTHSELAQVTSLVMLGSFVGNAIGSAIAGGIYTGKLRERLHVRLGGAVGEVRLDQLYNSITGALPAWGTSERVAVNQAYSDVMGYISYAALAVSVPVVLLTLVLPDKRLGNLNRRIFRCLKRTVYVTFPGEVIDVHHVGQVSFFSLVLVALATSYDYIVVGGGACGLVMANRLSEDLDHSVLIIERGGSVLNNALVYDTSAYSAAFATSIDYAYQSAPQTYMGNKVETLRAGKALGPDIHHWGTLKEDRLLLDPKFVLFWAAKNGRKKIIGKIQTFMQHKQTEIDPVLEDRVLMVATRQPRIGMSTYLSLDLAHRVQSKTSTAGIKPLRKAQAQPMTRVSSSSTSSSSSSTSSRWQRCPDVLAQHCIPFVVNLTTVGENLQD
ncbi:hypothetical protein CNMCM5793_009626 [Aspergillus hiratsukae]|uniref:Major facilitator superfamily (MFS) profile domain-containing protein n=1 Tax=Aspergillus hiratsukae TaxID=1194566 RepID=A0A8H6P1P1_9EURO|nr:hypothetical protein CNMCM5793_009626 [Aspergillus hiratsukae]KAF7156228.1 hypothetical protein CNMCM6106_009293 [Aspergillus hiratsukae]